MLEFDESDLLTNVDESYESLDSSTMNSRVVRYDLGVDDVADVANVAEAAQSGVSFAIWKIFTIIGSALLVAVLIFILIRCKQICGGGSTVLNKDSINSINSNNSKEITKPIVNSNTLLSQFEISNQQNSDTNDGINKFANAHRILNLRSILRHMQRSENDEIYKETLSLGNLFIPQGLSATPCDIEIHKGMYGRISSSDVVKKDISSEELSKILKSNTDTELDEKMRVAVYLVKEGIANALNRFIDGVRLRNSSYLLVNGLNQFIYEVNSIVPEIPEQKRWSNWH